MNFDDTTLALIVLRGLWRVLQSSLNPLFFEAIGSSVCGGYRLGILLSLLSNMAIVFRLPPPAPPVEISAAEVPRLMAFVFAGVFISWVGNACFGEILEGPL